MTTSLLWVVEALLCALVTCAEVTPKKDFNLDGMAGKWYVIGLATNAPWFVDHKAEMKTGTVTFTPTAEGDVDLSYTNLNADGTCWRMTHLANKTNTPGKFTYRSEYWNNDNDMRVVDVRYDDFALVHTIKTQNGSFEVLNQLYSRTPEVSTVLQQRFKQFSLETKILPDNIAILPKNGECPHV